MKIGMSAEELLLVEEVGVRQGDNWHRPASPVYFLMNAFTEHSKLWELIEKTIERVQLVHASDKDFGNGLRNGFRTIRRHTRRKFEHSSWRNSKYSSAFARAPMTELFLNSIQMTS